MELVPQVPSDLNANMRSGDMDISPISSFAYGQNHDAYYLLPHLSVSAYGPVGSIFLFSKTGSLNELDGARIALANTSASSQALLRILLEKFEQITPIYVQAEPHLPQMMEQADAALLIGDDAIRALCSQSSYHCFDLGALWHQRTGLGMSFAVWVVHKSLFEEKSEWIQSIGQRLIEAKEKGLSHLDDIVRAAEQKVSGVDFAWEAYFKGLCYDFGERELEGLRAFYQYAFELGLLLKPVKMELIPIEAGASR